MMVSSLVSPGGYANWAALAQTWHPSKYDGGNLPTRCWRFRIETLDAIVLIGVIYNQMVVDQFSDADIDRVFQALADATRRDIMHKVTLAEYTVSGLAAYYAMSFAAIQKHVAVLERAHLVSKEKRGREQIVRANPEGLKRARQLLDEYEEIWRQRAARITNILMENPEIHPKETS